MANTRPFCYPAEDWRDRHIGVARGLMEIAVFPCSDPVGTLAPRRGRCHSSETILCPSQSPSCRRSPTSARATAMSSRYRAAIGATQLRWVPGLRLWLDHLAVHLEHKQWLMRHEGVWTLAQRLQKLTQAFPQCPLGGARIVHDL
jgi:hypothetical protein